MDLFRKIFGMNFHDDQQTEYSRYTREDDDREKFFQEESFIRSFDVFSDPIQMHQYFEHQMNEVLKMFGFNGTTEFSMGFPNLPTDGWSQTPFEDPSNNLSNNLRDQFLKPGFEKPSANSEMIDKDLDEKVKSGDLNSVLGGKFDQAPAPYSSPKSFFYGTSQSMKTVTNADGSVETHRTTRDNEGNEESCVCRKIGSKEYCVIRKKDKYGKEEVTEKLVNMTEEERDIFNAKPKDIPKIKDENNPTNFPWSKFF